MQVAAVEAAVEAERTSKDGFAFMKSPSAGLQPCKPAFLLNEKPSALKGHGFSP
jgi:hypothetical protein